MVLRFQGLTLPEVLLSLALASLLTLGVLGTLAPLLRWDLALGLRRAATDQAEVRLEEALAQARQRQGFEDLVDLTPPAAEGLVWRRQIAQPAPGLKSITITVWAEGGGQLACLATVAHAP